MNKEKTENVLYLNSPIGLIEIKADDKYILALNFVDENGMKEDRANQLLLEAKRQLDEYFKGDRKEFSLPLKLEGTVFQKEVWKELLKIEYGKTASYGQVADNINNKKASRAVGGANNKNKISIMIPCHRVIGSKGKLVGYGSGLWRKEWLLDHERNNKNE